MALARVIQGGLIGASMGMAVGYFTGRTTTPSAASFPFDIPEVENNAEASYLCLQLGEFRAYSNEVFSTVCKHLNKILLFEKMVNNTSESIDAGISKKAHKYIFETKESLEKINVPDVKKQEWSELKESIEKLLNEKKHNIDLGVSSRLDNEY